MSNTWLHDLPSTREVSEIIERINLILKRLSKIERKCVRILCLHRIISLIGTTGFRIRCIHNTSY